MLHLMVHKYTNPGAYLDYAQNVILQSTWQWVMPTIEQQLNASRKFAASRGCNQTTSADILACMRALPANRAVSTSGFVNYFQPSVDGVFLTDQPYNLIKRGEYNTNANVIIGYTQDEGNYLANSRSSWKPPTANLTYADYVRIVGTNSLSFWLTPAQIDETLARYADSTAKLGYWYGIAELLGQFYITCGSTFAAPYFAQHGPTYAFIWNYTSPNYPDQFLQAAHGNELPYIFNATVYTAYNFAPIDYAHSARMLAAWARIATRSRPDTSVWPRYTANNPVAYMWEQTDLNLNPPAKVVPFFRSNLCSFWEPFFSQNSAVQP
jgi:carboxylesterase type B